MNFMIYAIVDCELFGATVPVSPLPDLCVEEATVADRTSVAGLKSGARPQRDRRKPGTAKFAIKILICGPTQRGPLQYLRLVSFRRPFLRLAGWWFLNCLRPRS